MSDEEVKHDRRPADTPFKQQRLKAWQPILTPKWVIITFLTIAGAFIPIGIVILVTSNNVVEVSQRYDNLAACNLEDTSLSSLNCTVELEIPEKMERPVYLYYELRNFYQNHRRYVKSRSDAQLRGETGLSSSDLSDCDPLITEGSKKLYPCGLIANSFFNDQFRMYRKDSDGDYVEDVHPTFTKTGIAWPSDLNKKFKDRPLAADEVRPAVLAEIPNFSVQDEDFVVWMRTAGLPTFRKLNRILHDDIGAGSKVQIGIVNKFKVHPFDGEKHVVLSTTSWLGGKNSFLGYAYIVVGSICLALATAFGIKQTLSPRKLGDASYLRPNQAPAMS